MILMLCLTIQLLAFHAGMLYSSRSTSTSHEGLPLRVRRRELSAESGNSGCSGIFHEGLKGFANRRFTPDIGTATADGADYTKSPPPFKGENVVFLT